MGGGLRGAARGGLAARPYSNAEALSVLLAARGGHHAVVGRRLARKDAALTAAGAAGTAAAVLGTAAIVRHARKRNKT